MAAVLNGVEQWRLGIRCVAMNTRRRTMLYGIMVASMQERSDKVDASVSSLRMDRWKMEVTALAACGAHGECARSVWDPIQVVAWMRHPTIDVRASPAVRPPRRHFFRRLGGCRRKI